jgi:hypothetical protein
MTRATKTTRAARVIERTIPLKTVHNDIMKSNPNATCTPKTMRVWLRANMRDIHAHNNAWIFAQSEYDLVRAHFDPKYRATLERAARPKKTRAKKADAPTPDATV